MTKAAKTSRAGGYGAGTPASGNSDFHLSGLVQCVTCGRSGGNIRLGHSACTRCRAQDAPTALQAWRSLCEMAVADMAAHSGLTEITIQRALRGEPMGLGAASALSELTGIPVEELCHGSQEEV